MSRQPPVLPRKFYGAVCRARRARSINSINNSCVAGVRRAQVNVSTPSHSRVPGFCGEHTRYRKGPFFVWLSFSVWVLCCSVRRARPRRGGPGRMSPPALQNMCQPSASRSTPDPHRHQPQFHISKILIGPPRSPGPVALHGWAQRHMATGHQLTTP